MATVGATPKAAGAPPGEAVEGSVPETGLTLTNFASRFKTPVHLVAALMEALGGDINDDPEVVLAVPASVMLASLVELTVNGEAVLPIQQGKLSLFLKNLAKAFEPEVAPSPTAVVPALPLPAPPSDALQAKRKLSEVLDEIDDTLVSPLTTDERQACRLHHRAVTGGNPPEHATPTADQLAGLKTKLSFGSPFVSFSLFGPFGRRRLQMRKFSAQTFVDGQLQTKTLAGPGNFDSWFACWEVFRAAMIMLDAASPAALDAYGQGIRELVSIYPNHWGVIVVADELMRAENWGNISEDLADEGSLDTARPWNQILKLTAFGSGQKAHWWDMHVIYPCGSRSSTKINEASHLDGAASHSKNKRQRSNDFAGSFTSSASCLNWNRGACAPFGECPNGHAHVCSSCGGPHRAIACGPGGRDLSKGNNDNGKGGGNKKSHNNRRGGGKGSKF
jgi:hypothetical protein